MNLCIKRSDFNTTGMFHLGMNCSHHARKEELSLKSSKQREQDGRGVGGCGVHLSSQIHQEYTFRHRSACRTPAESQQEYLTSGKEYMLLLSCFSRVRLCDPIDSSPPGSPIPGILQARTLEWVAVSFSNA